MQQFRRQLRSSEEVEILYRLRKGPAAGMAKRTLDRSLGNIFNQFMGHTQIGLAWKVIGLITHPNERHGCYQRLRARLAYDTQRGVNTKEAYCSALSQIPSRSIWSEAFEFFLETTSTQMAEIHCQAMSRGRIPHSFLEALTEFNNDPTPNTFDAALDCTGGRSELIEIFLFRITCFEKQSDQKKLTVYMLESLRSESSKIGREEIRSILLCDLCSIVIRKNATSTDLMNSLTPLIRLVRDRARRRVLKQSFNKWAKEGKE